MKSFEFNPKKYPEEPGCYLMKNAKDRVIYVGKAKNLRNRLGNYFQKTPDRLKSEVIAKEIFDIEVIIVNNELESFILENNLIKRYRPKYNSSLMRDKTGYSYIVMTGEKYPRFVAYKKNIYNKELEGIVQVSKPKRFGPYVSRDYRDILLSFINESFELKTCKLIGKRACLRYHLSKCSGICEKKISDEEYGELAKNAAAFLAHRHRYIIREMRDKMYKHAERLEFEKAQTLKHKIEALEYSLEKQIVERDEKHDQDVIFFGRKKVLVLKLEKGTLYYVSLYELEQRELYAEACQSFLLANYSESSPPELIVNKLSAAGELEVALTSRNGYRINLTLPKQGIKQELLKLARKNYEYRTGDHIEFE